MPQELKPNSHKYREAQQTNEKKNVEKVVKGKVITKKQPISKKFANTFISEDVSNVKSYLFFDVFIPALKDTVSSMLSTGVDMLLYGEARSSSRRGGRARSYNSYDRYYSEKDSRKSGRNYGRSSARERYNYNEVILDTRVEAEDVLDHLIELVEDYGMASVADLYQLVGERTEFTDNNYGWFDLKTAGVTRVSDGYLINLPPTKLLD